MFKQIKNAEQIADDKAKQVIAQTVSEYKTYLNNTDHKFLQGYVVKPGEDLSAIETTRNEYREFVRANKGAEDVS